MVHTGAGRVREELRAFSEELARLLQIRNVTGADLADDVGVSASTITNWKLGRARPGEENVAALERCLSVPPGHLARRLGYVPVADEEVRGGQTFEEFLTRDPHLTAGQREILTEIYAEFLRSQRSRPQRDQRAG